MHRYRWIVLVTILGLFSYVAMSRPAAAAPGGFSTALADHTFDNIAVDLSGSNAVFAAGSDAQNFPYVYKTTNQGASWTAMTNGLPSPMAIFALAISVSNPLTLYLGGYNFSANQAQLYRTTDGGNTWTQVGATLGNVSVQAIAVDPTNSNTVYVGTNSGVYKAADGATFVPLSGMATRNVQALQIDPTNPAVIYAGTNPATNGGVWKSSDGGATWAQMNEGLPGGTGAFYLAATPGSATTFYAAVGTSPSTTVLYKTTSAGSSWTALALASSAAGIAVSPTNSNLVVVSGGSGLFRSTDGGNSFTLIGGNVNAPVGLDNSNPQSLYVGGQGISSYTGDVTAISSSPTPTPSATATPGIGTPTVTPTAGTPGPTVTTTPGATGAATLTGSLWFDDNGNGIKDNGEAAAAGAALNVVCTSCTGTPSLGTTTADANGNYSLANLPIASGQVYTVIATATRSGGPQDGIGPNYSGESALELTPGQTATVAIGLVPLDNRYFSQTGFRIDNDTIWNYFNRRGAVTTFGYPTSRTFTFQGFTVQFFQRRVVQIDNATGQARLLNLLDPGLLSYTNFNGSTFPGVDPSLVSTSPNPTNQPAVISWVQQHAPNSFNGQPVNFWSTFENTVSAQVAFPNGGDPSLLPGIDLEMWGVPTSQPVVDPNNHGFIYLRWQRGIMMYDASCNCTQGILLADYLKDILTGRNLPADLNQEAQGSQFYLQYDPSQPNWVHNASLLTSTNLTNAFTQE